MNLIEQNKFTIFQSGGNAMGDIGSIGLFSSLRRGVRHLQNDEKQMN